MPDRLEDLLNLGPVSAKMLRAAGIETPDQLRACGAVLAYLRVWQAGGRPSRNLLWAIEGALTGLRFDQLDPARRRELQGKLDAATL